MPDRNYTNPVYPRNFPDPFVLRFNGRYYAYATDRAADGRLMQMLSSPDLVHWEAHGGILEPLELEGCEEYWAPEVAYWEGTFYLYYAVGREADPDHHLRVATAQHPLGPWTDSGVNMTPHEIFAIDAHPFRDPADGQWYLFYARDRLEAPYAGTGVVVDRLLAMDRLEGKPREVLRPYAEWQVFELQRAVKKGLDWYTVEGPFTLRVDGKYCCLYSGGRWENPNYGVGYALADHPLGPWTDDTNAAGPLVLTTRPGAVIGPGHNSVTLGPDLRSHWIVYHGWDPGCTARMMRIDPLRWEGPRPSCDGPSSEPRPAPALPTLLSRFDEADPGAEWDRKGAWIRDAEGLTVASDTASLKLNEPAGEFVAEASVQLEGSGSVCIRLGPATVTLTGRSLLTESRSVPVPVGFRPDAWHRLFLTRSGDRLSVTLDDFPALDVHAEADPAPLELAGETGARFCHFALTRT